MMNQFDNKGKEYMFHGSTQINKESVVLVANSAWITSELQSNVSVCTERKRLALAGFCLILENQSGFV